MRRFWKEVTLEQSTFGYAVRLDGRPVKTPTRNELVLPTQRLADAVVAEWDAVETSIDPARMPMTGFANAAIDRVGPDRDAFAAAIASYGETDLMCYRAEQGEALAVRQAEIWDPWLKWAQGRYGSYISRSRSRPLKNCMRQWRRVERSNLPRWQSSPIYRDR